MNVASFKSTPDTSVPRWYTSYIEQYRSWTTHRDINSQVSWGCRIHLLHLYRRVGLPSLMNVLFDSKLSDVEVPLIQELWEIWITFLLPSIPGLLWSGEVAPDRVRSMGLIELNCVLMLNWIVWNRTVLIYKKTDLAWRHSHTHTKT